MFLEVLKAPSGFMNELFKIIARKVSGFGVSNHVSFGRKSPEAVLASEGFDAQVDLEVVSDVA
jgi:hypothetical protein